MNASLREIVLAVRYGDASLVGESVGYLILGACDRALAVPRGVDLDGVLVTGEGDVALDATPVSEDEAERSLRFLLGQLLTLLRTPFPNLARVAAREPCGLGHLVTELEAALVPVNRKAARRSLSRLVRETRKSLAKEHAHAAVVDIPQAPQRAAAPLGGLFALTESPLPEPVISERSEPALPEQVWAEPALPEPALPEPVWAEPALPEPAEIAPPAEPAAWEVEVEWVDEVPSLFAEAATPVPARASFEAPALGSEGAPAPTPAPTFPDDFDDALTRVTTAVETLPPPEIQLRSSFNLRRLVTTAALEGPLLPTLASASQSPSSIQDLLHRMRLEGEPTEVVLADLARLARVDLSPPAPPVG